MATKILIDNLCFGEGPRWRDGALWLSDMHDRKVLRVAAQGNAETVLELEDDEPSGLGWLPNGDLLIVSMGKKRLLRFDGAQLTVHADLGELATWHCNDMVVDEKGHAYVGNFGFDLHTNAEPRPAEIILVQADGTATIQDDGVMFPNGCVITPDGKTFIVGESFGGCLSAFDIAEDGSLSNKRLWAQLPEGAVPDGICQDDQGGIWAASPTSNECIRLLEGGEVTHRIDVGRSAIACAIGGDELFVLTSTSIDPDQCRANRDGRVEVYPAPYPRAGWP
jgi:sugar lactone lactonase YvrE